MESGQVTHCPTVAFASLRGRWGVPPPGAFSERVLVFTVVEFCVNRIFKVTLALQPRSRCFEDYWWWVRQHPGVSLWWHSPAKPCSFSPCCKARTQLFQTARAGGGPGCPWPTPHSASGQRPRGWRVRCWVFSEAMMPMQHRAWIHNSLSDLSSLWGTLGAKATSPKSPSKLGSPAPSISVAKVGRDECPDTRQSPCP